MGGATRGRGDLQQMNAWAPCLGDPLATPRTEADTASLKRRFDLHNGFGHYVAASLRVAFRTIRQYQRRGGVLPKQISILAPWLAVQRQYREHIR